MVHHEVQNANCNDDGPSFKVILDDVASQSHKPLTYLRSPLFAAHPEPIPASVVWWFLYPPVLEKLINNDCHWFIDDASNSTLTSHRLLLQV